MAKNYIEQFMKDNNLSVDTYFKVEGHRGKYMLDSDYFLWYKPVNSQPAVDGSATIVDLLTGKLRPISKMERVAEILGVKLGEKFNIKANSTGDTQGPFKLTGHGIESDKIYGTYPTCLELLLTGEYEIVPIEQEES